MSVKYIDRAFRAPSDVRGSTRMVLVALADSADDDGYSHPRKVTLAGKCGLSPKGDTLRVAVAWLEERGYLVRHINAFHGKPGGHAVPEGLEPNYYQLTVDDKGRPVGPGLKRSVTTAGGPAPGQAEPRKAQPTPTRNSGRPPTRNSGRPPTRNSGSRTVIDPSEEPKPPLPPLDDQAPAADEHPPSPPGGGDAVIADQLFEPEIPTQRQRRAAAAKETAEFAHWWEHRYPRTGGSRGSRKAAWRNWVRLLREGKTLTQVEAHTDRYIAARAAYRAVWGEDAQAPLMQGATFLNGKFDLFDHDWTTDDLAYWPGPGGQTLDANSLPSGFDSGSVVDSTSTPKPSRLPGESFESWALRLNDWEEDACP